MVWYSHLLKNFPQFAVIHTVKGFGIINEAEVDAFLKLSCFFGDPTDAGNLISGSSAFLKSTLNIWKFTVHALLSLARRILSITLLAWEVSAFVLYFENSLVLSFFEIGLKTPFPVLWPLLSFPNLLVFWVQHFHSIIFQDLK